VPIQLPTLARRLALASLLGVALGATLGAAAIPARAEGVSGAYLAAMQADFRNDYTEAAAYYDEALALDPTNLRLLTNATVAHVAMGDFKVAGGLADRLEAVDPNNQVATLVRLGDRIAAGDFDAADAILKAAGETVNPLLGGLLAGWIEVGREDFPAAQAKFDALQGNEALLAYGQYHKALALALAGDFVSAEALMAGGDKGPLHLNRSAVVAHAQILAQLGREKEAAAMIDAAMSEGQPDAPLLDLRNRLADGEEVPFDQVTSARDGAAEVFLTLADALNAPDTQRVALVHSRLAQEIRPDLVEAHLLSAQVLEDEGQFALATEALASVPETSSWYVTTQIRRAATQRAAGDPDAGIATLEALAKGHGDMIEVESALGDALRAEEKFAEAAEAYTRAIVLAGKPRPAHWVLFYTRGISYERAGDWPKAEADFREALRLEPDQPLVLNYLGYSLVEKHESLDEALGMIEKAAKDQPNDGYITDSLGWVLYRLGRYQDAVAPMLRAVELTPDDAVINDHLGDVLWKVGRKREAEFQWRRALSFGPADDLDMDRIRKKLAEGLDKVLVDDPARDG
jgi:Flp pilus assembly protein TadD